MDGREKVAERLKAARSLAGYSNRKDFCAHFGLSYDTLDGWERGKNPLTLKGARRIVESLKLVGIYCSEEWLMKGTGASPRPFQEIIPTLSLNPHESLNLFEQQLNLATELSTFTTLNKNSILTIIRDDSMLPFYEKGDYVGGIKLMGQEIEKAIHKRCIVEFSGTYIVVGQLKKLHTTYQVCPGNKQAGIAPTKEDSSLKILSVAPILWHRTFLPQ